MEAFVWRRSVVGGDAGSGFLLELFRESHAKGPVSFLDGVGVGAGVAFSCAGGGGGGGGNATGAILPERPCRAPADSRDSRGGNFGRTLGAMHLPPSRETSSMSEVTDIRCAVRRGDLPGSGLAPLGTSGTSGGGESVLLSWAVDVDDPRLLKSDRDRDRSECESGRGVISVASSKLSYTRNVQSARIPRCRIRQYRRTMVDSRRLCRSCARLSAGWACPPWLQGSLVFAVGGAKNSVGRAAAGTKMDGSGW